MEFLQSKKMQKCKRLSLDSVAEALLPFPSTPSGTCEKVEDGVDSPTDVNDGLESETANDPREPTMTVQDRNNLRVL